MKRGALLWGHSRVLFVVVLGDAIAVEIKELIAIAQIAAIDAARAVMRDRGEMRRALR
jgi:hypothetical protein